MDLILATSGGQEECYLDCNYDIDIGSTNDFQLTFSYPSWDDRVKIGKMVYVPGTEYGGIIKAIDTSTETDIINVKGYTWRGYLQKRIIEPLDGMDYYVASGELNECIASVLNRIDLPLFAVATANGRNVNTGVNVNYRFPRYCTAADGLSGMLQSVGFRLDIKFVHGHVQLQAVPAINYGSVEISQDSRLNFNTEDNQMGVTTLVCLGTGELRNRIVRYLYADKNGNISEAQTIFGIDEIQEIFDNPAADADTLIQTGKDRFKTLISKKSFSAAVKDIDDIDLNLGDTITGRDYITGLVITKPIVDKIAKMEGGKFSVDYKIEGET